MQNRIPMCISFISTFGPHTHTHTQANVMEKCMHSCRVVALAKFMHIRIVNTTRTHIHLVVDDVASVRLAAIISLYYY